MIVPPEAGRRHGFRRRDARAIYDAHFGPNMTPMVDVVMVILIFFMAGTAVLGPELLLRTAVASEPRPVAGGREAPERPRAELGLELPSFTVRLRAAAGSVVVEGFGLRGEPLARLEAAAIVVAAELAAAGVPVRGEAGVSVVIDPAPEVPWEAVVRAREVVAASGFERVGLR